ncbi:MAG: hypothetical protein L3K00_07770 [Thermoplasmata archaeon]|nr:hypothetical protein [Thermoplasmata archaeon]
MPMAIVAAAVARPSARLGPLAVEAPDEDAFTLAMAAAEALGERARSSELARIDLVGDHAPEAEWAVPEALGLGGVAIHRTSGGPAHLFEAIRGHEGADPPGTRLLLAVDLSRVGRATGTNHGALAVALALGPGPGIRVDHVATHARSPRGETEGLRVDRLGRPHGSEPTALLILGDDERVVAAARTAGGPGFATSLVPRAPPGTGPAPTTPFALALRAPGVDDLPHPFVLAALGAERDVHVRGTVTGSVAWSEATPSPTLALSAPPVRDDERSLDARSEGAYVPRPRYIENLPSRWRLEADWCPSCSRLTFPARGACAHCGRTQELERRSLARSVWTVDAATIVRPGAQPTEFDGTVAVAGAYGVVVARSSEGPRATFQLVGPATPVPIGSRVVPVLRRLYPMEGEWRYGRKAIVVAASDAR